MKKRKFKIRNISEIVLYLILILMGIIIMSFPAFGIINPIYYLGSLLYIFSFFNIIAYFINRRENEYELLFQALISILAGSFLFAIPNDNTPFMLGTGILIFTLLMIVNKSFYIYVDKSKNNYLWLIKFIVTFLIAFLSILTIINLYNELSVQTLMIGYYFISLGTMLLIEPLIYHFISPEKLSKIVKEIFKEEEPKQLKPKRKQQKK